MTAIRKFQFASKVEGREGGKIHLFQNYSKQGRRGKKNGGEGAAFTIMAFPGLCKGEGLEEAATFYHPSFSVNWEQREEGHSRPGYPLIVGRRGEKIEPCSIPFIASRQ